MGVIQEKLHVPYRYGHAWNPDYPQLMGLKESDIDKLNGTEDESKALLRSYSEMMAYDYTKLNLKHHGRMPEFDGEFGPAMDDLLATKDRCPVPDYAPPLGLSFGFADPQVQEVFEVLQTNQTLPALGVGNWKGCNNLSDVHSANVRWDLSNIPDFLLNGVFAEVLTHVQKAYAGIGLLFNFVDKDNVDLVTNQKRDDISHIHIEASFVRSSNGWIGLAIVGKNQTCSRTIWAKFLNRYKGGTSRAAIIQQWVTLIKHEFGHNTGMMHTRGGVMNSILINGLPFHWPKTDPAFDYLVRHFSGVPVDIGDPKPPKPKPPKTDLDKLVAEFEDYKIRNDLKNAMQDALYSILIDRIKVLEKNNAYDSDSFID